MSVFTLDVTTYGDIDQIIASMRGTESQVQLAAMRALNKTALWLKSQSVKEISAQKKLQQKIIRERLKLVKASKSNLLGVQRRKTVARRFGALENIQSYFRNHVGILLVFFLLQMGVNPR